MKKIAVNNLSLIALIITFLISIQLIGQNETSHWYFGENAGLYFNLQNNPNVLLNGNMIASDACATISDINGNLQFYTNGINVWDASHNIMVNGVLFEPLGPGGPISLEPNKLLNVIIIPITDIQGLYYVFTITSANGLRYSVIDMNGNNGLGEVVQKNINLLPLEGVGKLSAVHHADGKSIWLLTTKKNDEDEYTSFYAYKIETNGSIADAVITKNLFYNGVQLGQMKLSPNGKKIAVANYRPQMLSNHLMIFDFNPENGIVSNRQNLLTSFVFFEVVSAFGVEFSNDSKYLYASLIRQGVYSENGDDFQADEERNNLIYQYDIANANPHENWTSLHEDISNLTAAGLQLAKNGKIYRALTINENSGIPYLGVVQNPDKFGTQANYTHNQVDLSTKKSRLGLPSFIQSYFRTRVLVENGCVGNAIPMEVDTYADISAATWDFGDGNVSNDINPQHTYNVSGNYKITATITVNNRPITVTKNIIVYNLPNLLENQDIEQCDEDIDGISIFNLYAIRSKITNPLLNEELVFYETKEDADLDINRIANPENYTNTIPNQEIYIRAINENGCSSTSSFSISANYIELGVIPDIYSCDQSDAIPNNEKGVFPLGFSKSDILGNIGTTDDVVIRYYPSYLDALTSQNEIIDRFFTTESTTVWVKVEEENLSCSGISSMNLIVNTAPRIDLEDEYLICKNEPILLSGDASNNRFEWLSKDGTLLSTQKDYTIIEPGSYQHIAYKTENNIECFNKKEFVITRTEQPRFTAVDVNESSRNKHSITISIEGSSTYEFSMNNTSYYSGDKTYTFENVPAGKHTIYVRDINNCEPTITEDVYILGYPSYFTPNNDGVNDVWRVLGLNEADLETINIKIYDRFGKFIVNLNKQNNFSWNGTYNGMLVPQNDYWFEAILLNGTIHRGHFTLKR